jgi:hypothetical protein
MPEDDTRRNCCMGQAATRGAVTETEAGRCLTDCGDEPMIQSGDSAHYRRLAAAKSSKSNGPKKRELQGADKQMGLSNHRQVKVP